MADQDKMSPDASPGVANKIGGVRRVNKRPMYIAIGCVVAFCLVVAYVANKRANQGTQETAEATKSRGSRDTSAMAMDVMGGGSNGLIAAPAAPRAASRDCSGQTNNGIAWRSGRACS